MTEDEAKRNWCPMARCADYGRHNAANRDSEGYAQQGAKCFASGCMMWRWNGALTGYCGLAGAPSA